MLYMAYGMNTNRDAMSVRCPKAKPLGGFYLPDTRLVFRGVGDIMPDKEAICPVVLWDITPDCLRALDNLEGYPTFYGRRKMNSGWITYEMVYKSRTKEPNGGYYKMIEDGYKDFGLDDYWLRLALQDAEELAA
tara:strand:- start:846 stop:1247 length:402 start_codon:yes stop_codon:yes gene_type:complete